MQNIKVTKENDWVNAQHCRFTSDEYISWDLQLRIHRDAANGTREGNEHFSNKQLLPVYIITVIKFQVICFDTLSLLNCKRITNINRIFDIEIMFHLNTFSELIYLTYFRANKSHQLIFLVGVSLSFVSKLIRYGTRSKKISSSKSIKSVAKLIELKVIPLAILK